jgi:hypothetical protein
VNGPCLGKDMKTTKGLPQGSVFVNGRHMIKLGCPSSAPTGLPTSTQIPGGGPRPSLPHLPGADFAASMATGVQSFSSKVVGNITEFTSGITNVTNPPPKPTSSGRSFGGRRWAHCACLRLRGCLYALEAVVDESSTWAVPLRAQ